MSIQIERARQALISTKPAGHSSMPRCGLNSRAGKYFKADDAADNERQIPRGVGKLIVGMRRRTRKESLSLSLSEQRRQIGT